MACLADSTPLAGHQLVNLPLPLLQHAEAARLWQQGGGLRLQSETQGGGCFHELGWEHSIAAGEAAACRGGVILGAKGSPAAAGRRRQWEEWQAALGGSRERVEGQTRGTANPQRLKQLRLQHTQVAVRLLQLGATLRLQAPSRV